jgi:FkbM family methyltransferase
VLLAQAGETAAARDLLAALGRVVPDHDDARENLAALDAAPAGAAGADPAMGPARARLLGLVTELVEVHLPDNADTLLHPWGAELPDPAGRGQRLADALAVLDRCGPLWRDAGDERTRDLLLRLLAWRVLGPAHVRLQLDPAHYRQAVIGLSARGIVSAGVLGAPGLPLEWQFHEYDLTAIGVDVRLVGVQLPLASTFLFSQYAHRDPLVAAGPRPGDVALDVGGCWGDTALWLAEAVGPTGRVHTFEPSGANRRLLGANLARNPRLAGRVAVHDAPLGPAPGQRVLMPDVLAAGARAVDAPVGTEGLLELTSDSIDAMVARGELDRVDFIKVDVEGADVGVLAGAVETIRAHRPRLALAAYHAPDDLVTLPAQVAASGVAYRWHLQCSTMADVDSVLLGVPA